MDNFSKLLFVRPLLLLMGQGKFFARVMAMAVRACAALVVLFSLTTFFQVGKLLFALPASGIPGAVIFELLFVIGIYAVVHVLLLRARDLEQLAVGEWYALPLAAVIMRMLGETYAAFVSLVAIGTGVFVWFTNMSVTRILNPTVRPLFPGMRDNPSFMGGIEFMVSGALAGLAVLVLSYVLAEVFELLTRLAARANDIQKNGHGAEPAYRSRFGS